MANLILIKDTLAPDLARKLRAVSNRKPLLDAMGQAVKSLAVRAFTEAGLRPSTWEKRQVEPADGHLLLQDSTMLIKSIRVISVDDNQVTIGSDRPYAAAHQLGYPENNLPARPYLPFDAAGALTPKGKTAVERSLRAGLAAHGL